MFRVVLTCGFVTLGNFCAVASVPAVAEKALSSQLDVDGFRTVDQAVKAKIRLSGASMAHQPAYFGVALAVGDSQVLVEEVAPESPAQQAGLKKGDHVISVNGIAIDQPQRLSNILKRLPPNELLSIRLKRSGKRIDLTAKVVPVSRPLTNNSQNPRRGVLGVRVQSSTSPKGARVDSVFDGSAASKGGLKVGDVITKIAERDITDSNTLIRFLSRSKPGDKFSLVTLRAKKVTTIEVELGSLPSRSRPSGTATRTGEYKLAIIPVEYPDQKHNPKIQISDWKESLFSEGTYRNKSATGQTVFGSLNDYYRELSCGVFGVEGVVFDWVEVSKNRESYLKGSKSALLTEALDKLLEREGAKALDGYDGIFFMYAGARVRTSRGALYWPHRGSVTHRRKRWSYFIMQEGGQKMSDISVMCHEFGHMLGLPDLYSTDSRTEGLSVWCAMSNQAGRGRPQHFSAWCKERLGWLKPTIIDPTVKQKLILGPVENSDSQCFKVLIHPDGSEYLLLENRRRIRFDASLPGEGLLVWRVVNNRPLLEESHGIGGPAGPSSYRDAVPYPSRSNTSFTPLTTPSSESVSGNGLPVHITNIRELPDGRITFYMGYQFQ